MDENRLNMNDSKTEAITVAMGIQAVLKWNQNYMIINSE